MAARYIDDVDIILFDQGKTFMFENDRFGVDAGCHATYVGLGGRLLGRQQLEDVVGRLFDYMLERSHDTAGHDCFPTIPEAIRSLPALGVEPEDYGRIDDLFGLHELGVISSLQVDTLKQLSLTHRLGIISNVWGGRKQFELNLERHGVLECFAHRVWSSDHRRIKPSRWLFEHALESFGAPPERVLFVGDDPKCDIDPAKMLGMKAAWVRNPPNDFPTGLRKPDLVLGRIDELLAI